MIKLQRYLSAFLCLVLLMTGTLSFAEEPEVTVLVTEEPFDAPTSAPTSDPTSAPSEEPSDAPTSGVQDAPTAKPKPTIEFKKDRLEFKLSEIGKDFDYEEEFELEIEHADDDKLIWSTDDDDIAAFVAYDEDGELADEDTPEDEIVIRFEAYTAGSVKVRAALVAHPGVYDEFTLVLTEGPAPDPVYALSLDKESLALNVGDTYTLTAAFTLDGEAEEDATLTWSVAGEAASVEDGLVTALAEGTATVTVSCDYDGQTYTATCDVTVTVPPVELTGISVEAVSIYSDETATLVVTPVPADAPFDPSLLAFEVDEESALYITASGAAISPVTADGILPNNESSIDAKVKVTYGDFTAEAVVTVKQAVTAIAIPGDSLKVLVGKTIVPEIILLPETAQEPITSVSSSDESVFTVSDDLTLTGVARGVAKLTVTTRGKSAEFDVIVLQGTASMAISVPSGNLRIGETVQLTIIDRLPADADDAIAWSSSDESLATVDETGLVSLLAPGDVIITATAESGMSVSVGLKIIRPATAITLYDDIFHLFQGYMLVPGQYATPFVTVHPADATDRGFTMTSDNEAIAVVVGDRVYGRSAGYANVTIRTNDGEVSRSFIVRVNPASKAIKSLKLSKSSISLKEGKTASIRATVNSGAQSKTVLWGTSNPEVALVNNSGTIKAVGPGVAYVYAMTYSGIYQRVKVTVTQQLPTSVKLNKSSVSMYADTTYQLKAAIAPSNVNPDNRVLRWTTSNPRIAIVNDEGLVFAISPGTAYVRAYTVNGKTYRCKITVKKRAVTAVAIQNPYGELLVGGRYILNYAVKPANATNQAVTWALASSSYKSYATVNSSTGEIYCKKPGTIKVTATAKDGSRKKATITLKIQAVPLTSLSLVRDGIEIGQDATIELAYGTSFTMTAEVVPEMFLEWKTTDARVATIEDGVVTATGAGECIVGVIAGGQYTYKVNIVVPRDDSQPTYRALVIGQYQSPSAKGYLPFSKNSTVGAMDALKQSVIGGERYSVTYKSDLTTPSQVTSAITSTLKDAKEGDVSVIYMLSHGSNPEGNYRWHLNATGSNYITGDQIVSAVKGLKGHVVLVLVSCYSGGDEEAATSVPGLIRSADRAAGDGTSYSVICSSDGMFSSSYANTIEHRSFDFFSHAFCKSLGWNLLADKPAALEGDSDDDGYVTLSELASSAKSLTSSELAAYIKVYGSSSFAGPASKIQTVTYYLSPDASALPIFGD